MLSSQVSLFWVAVVFTGVSVAQLALAFIVGCWYGEKVRGRRKMAQEYDAAAQALLRLHDWTTNVGDSVGAHQAEVEASNTRLQAALETNNDGWENLAVGIVQQIVDANQKLQQQLAVAEKKLNEQAEAIRMHATEARTDPLTGLPNRRALDDELQRRASEWRRKQTPFSVSLVDIDHFKRCNDQYGHTAGDEALRRVARVIRGTLSEMDFAARFGGEEFAIVHPATTLDEAQAASERVRQAVQEHAFEVNGQRLALTVSAGAAQAKVQEEPTALVARADEALYAAKSAARNRVRVHYGDSLGPDSGEAEPPRGGNLDEVCGELQRRLQEVAAG
ncbi:MAG: GGDEF domain-containing protein [Planctomycetia bacterium]|nr:GGDEF domain-containing protein [Planctomycetia bacterium]